MTKLTTSIAAILLTLIVPSLSGAQPVSLFDGNSLKGWNTVEQDQKFWSVKEGAITADSLGNKMPRNTFLFSEKEYDNFDFRCMFKLTGQPKTGMVNSGIQFRSAKHGKGSAKGYQADIGEPTWWGCLYDEHRRGLIAKSDMSTLKETLKPFGWNEYRIVANGPTITLYLNGIQTIQYIEKDPKIPAKGHFALQLHSGGICTIAYKDITITPLDYKADDKKESRKEGAKLAPGEVLFDDFESGTYKNWTVSGTAFGKAPIAASKVPRYQGQLNAEGDYLVNSHASAPGILATDRDKHIGTLSSKPFTISHDFIRLRVGGGNHKDGTCVNLMLLGDKKVASVTGDNSNAMSWKTINTSKWKGKQATIIIIDNVTGGWGNIGVDEIVFTDQAKPPAAIAKKVVPPKKKRRASLSDREGALSPEEQRAGFTVPEGYVVELVASEKDGVINPVDLTFDDAGRLWTGTAAMYPLDPNPSAPWGLTLKYMKEPALMDEDERFAKIRSLYQRKTLGTDKILVMDPFVDSLNVSTWAEGMTIPQSILPYKNGAFIAHGSEMLFMEDTDGDGKADKQTTVLSGFGFADTHTMSHLLIRGPGGWIHYSHGALNGGQVITTQTGQTLEVKYCKTGRFRLDGSNHELVNAGLNNIWGYQLLANGQWYGSEANDHGQSVTPMEPGTGYKGIGNDRLRPYQPFFPSAHSFRVGGTGLSGIAFAEDTAGSFPKEYRGVAFIANPITSKINAVRVHRNADGTVTGEHLDDFLTSDDDWFRPVNIEFGPDGCLYIADFYNKIISHNEVKRDHPERDKKHGRIWRVRYTGAKEIPRANIAELPLHKLFPFIRSPSVWAKRAAWHQIVDRKARRFIPELGFICTDKNEGLSTRIAALWALEGLRAYDEQVMDDCLNSDSDDLRREAARAMTHMPVKADKLAKKLQHLVEDTNAMVRSQVIRTLADFGKASPATIDLLVSFCKPDSPSTVLGGAYERKFERYLARMALENYPEELNRYLKSKAAAAQPSTHIDWARSALSGEWMAKQFLASWKYTEGRKMKEADFLAACDLLNVPAVNTAVKPVFEENESAYLVDFALKNPMRVRSAELDSLISPIAESMLKSKDKKIRLKGAVAGDQLQLQDLGKTIADVLPDNMDDIAFVNAASEILALNPRGNKTSISKLLQAGTLPTAATINSLEALSRADRAAGIAAIKQHKDTLTPTQQAALAHKLAQTRGGCYTLLDLQDQGIMTPAVIGRSLAERVASMLPKEDRAKVYAADHTKERAAIAAESKTVIKQLKTLAKSGTGKASKGKALFTAMCLSCHSADGKGAGFAPALDGSGHRELEHMLTAIVDPDAAVEGNYALYRVFLDDGSKVEGYLEKNTQNNLRLRFMGGGSMDIPHVDISTAGFVGGRSVMPRGLIDGLNDKQKADLIAYIRSMK